jgi:hypothetical protein
MRNFGASIQQGVLGVLELQDSRPCQVVDAVDNPLKDREDCGGFLGDAVLVLVIKRAVEAVQVQVQKH